MSKIQWTEKTWNPLTGCEEISPGCANCYAARMAKRLEAMGQEKYAGTTRTLANGKTVWTGKINLVEDALTIPLGIKKPTMWFVNSMSDLFHKDVPDEFIDKVFAVMALCPQHIFQVLTKRADRMAEYWSFFFRPNSIDSAKCEMMSKLPDQGRLVDAYIGEEDSGYFKHGRYLSNVWLGVSVEDQARADERIPHLLRTPAAIRFLSCEPLLENLDLWRYLQEDMPWPRVDLCIIGGESGPQARPCNVTHSLSLIQQCKTAGVKVFFKQAGSKPYLEKLPRWDDGFGRWQTSVEAKEGKFWIKLKDPKGGDPAEWPEDLRIREMPERNQ